MAVEDVIKIAKEVATEVIPDNIAFTDVKVESSNVDEDFVKNGLLSKGASPEIISKNLAELKANKVSKKKNGEMVMGADSVIDLKGELISKPTNRDEALNI